MTQPPPQRSNNEPAAVAPARRALIGTYVLETLTTGMYGEPRHTIREYVQNGYDAIRRARRNGWLSPDEGTITVTVDDGARTLSVRDDGTGITSGAAWATLSSVGASTKDRSNNAGFRGIGRLAGLAYCKRLLFVTKFGDEDVETTVTFDCDELRKGMDPKRGGGEDIQDLLSRAVTDQVRVVTDNERSLHYTEVVLEDTSLAPPELVSIDHLSSYLSQTAPVDFAPDWPFKDRIVEEARKAGLDLNTVRLVIRRPIAQVEETEGEDETEDEPRPGEPWEHEVFKPYRPTHKPLDREPVKVTGVKCVVDDGPNPRWWGWTGEIKLLAGLVDADAAGFRIRMQNIQVDGTEITDRIFTKISKSYDRLNIWFIGEIHMIGQDIVPNARRDGFEENTAWRDVQESLVPWFKTLSSRAYKASRTRGILAKKVKAAVAFAAVSRSRLAEGITADERQRLLFEIDEPVGVLKDELNADVVSAEDTAILRRTIGELNGLRKAVETIKPIVEGRIPSLELDGSEVLAIAFSVLEERLGPLDYRRTRRAIEERVENATRSRRT